MDQHPFTYVVGYFPIPRHSNAYNATHAAEAARQGKFEPMYERLCDPARSGPPAAAADHSLREQRRGTGLDMTRHKA